MQLKKLEYYIQAYKTFLQRYRQYSEEYKWESLKIFQDNWDIDAPDFATMYDQCLQNSYSRRLWIGNNYEPKKRMLDFIAINPEFIRRMFKDLFDENKAIENRISRFQFGCETMLEDYKNLHPTSIENNHYHDHEMISLYLGFRYPQQYTLFSYPAFKATMEKLGSANIPSPFDYERFYKIMRTIFTFIKKDEIILSIHRKKLNPRQHYTDETLLIVQDFYTNIHHLPDQQDG